MNRNKCASMKKHSIVQAVAILKQGGIIAYPTEAVFGLGCDPYNEKAVLRLLALKKRAVEKGLILIAATFAQVQPLTQKIDPERLKEILQHHAMPTTWVFPASKNTPLWLCGKHKTIALRLTTHPLAQELCRTFNRAIVSTSANIEGQAPARNQLEVLQQFPKGIDLIVDGATGGCKNPSAIRDAVTGKIIRQG